MDFAAASGSSVLSRLGTVPAKSPAGSGDVWYKVLVSGFVMWGDDCSLLKNM
jgi:hypothetical protein